MQPNMTQTAQAIQAQGRGNDSMLMHMSPREVGGLQALAMAHGGSLTINPKTGLPEAGFLEDILPTLLGVGLSFIPGVGPMMAAGIVGGGTAIATGDVSKGLMAGLGAFGGANLAAGLGAAGASGAASASGAGAAGAGTAGSALPSAAGPTVTLPVSGDVSLLQSFSGPQAGTTTAGLIDGGLSATGGSGVSAGLPPQTFTSNAAQAGRGFQNLVTGQPGSFDKFIGTAATPTTEATGLGGTMGAIKTAGSVLAPAFAPKPYEPPEGEESTYEGPYVPTERTVRYPTEEERRRLGTSEFTYFTPSNPVPGFQPFRAAQGGEVPDYKQGGIAALARGRKETRKGMPPRFLAGGGDGMSDSIPAVINGNQPARLADGEFVVPADVVSHLGNGSSKAGAKKLYAMMDRVRKARTGKKRQAPEVNMNRMMPA